MALITSPRNPSLVEDCERYFTSLFFSLAPRAFLSPELETQTNRRSGDREHLPFWCFLLVYQHSAGSLL